MQCILQEESRMGIKIGNNNKIIKSVIVQNGNKLEKKRTYSEAHPVLVSIFVSLLIGIILMFSFWSDFISWVEAVLS